MFHNSLKHTHSHLSHYRAITITNIIDHCKLWLREFVIRLCIAVSAHTDYSLQMMEQYIGLTANIYQSCDSPVHALQHFIINEIQRQIEQ